MDDLERTLSRLFARKVEEVPPIPSEPPVHVLKRIRWRQSASAITATLVVAALVLASFAGARARARGGGRPGILPTITTTSAPAPTPAHPGGSIVVGTREMPPCINPITSCAAAVGTWWVVLEHVMPRAMELDAGGNFVPSLLLVEAPSLENGELTENPFTITYHLNPEAGWADGTPITSGDFDFTWRAIMNTTGSYTTAGYDRIESIDTGDPKTVVIRFSSVFVDWQDLFGGGYGGLLEKAAFPQYENDPTPDLANEMQTGIPFSGGPWLLKSFSPYKAVLVPNDHYFGRVPLLDQVTILPFTYTTTTVAALKGGMIDAFPWPAEDGFLDQFSGEENIRAVAGGGGYFEALWFNHESPPLDDPRVREALMHAIDRQAMIDQVMRRFDPQAQMLNCGFLAVPGHGPWCNTTPFDQFTYDATKARALLTADGYDCTDTSKACTKNGADLTIDYSTVSTNDRRLEVQQLLKDRALPAGFDLRIKNYDAGTLFGEKGPQGQFTMADYSPGANPDPSVTYTLACESIPTKANDFTGGNWNRWCDQKATDLMHQSDVELDPGRRLELMDQIYAIEAKDLLSLPLYVFPEAAAWRTDRIDGPIGEYSGTEYGLFFNMNEWYLAGG